MGQPRATEAAVQKDIKSLFSQYEKDKPFDWQVKRQRVLGKKVIYDYRVRPEKIVTTDWVYTHSGQEYSSEDQIRSVILATRVSDPQCPATSLTEDPWVELLGLGRGDDGSHSRMLVDSGAGACAPGQNGALSESTVPDVE
uniref:Uncharacterized protein n=1 Tax=Panagrolaimus superbus TaxID=310955 RepID=A0A914YKY8_9BILA